MVWGGRREEGSGHVYLWQIHFDIWQNQYNIVKLKNKIKLKNFRQWGIFYGHHIDAKFGDFDKANKQLFVTDIV